jgi:hypothetical protein
LAFSSGFSPSAESTAKIRSSMDTGKRGFCDTQDAGSRSEINHQLIL